MSVVCSHRFGDRSFAKAAPGNQRKECLNGRFGPGGGGGGRQGAGPVGWEEEFRFRNVEFVTLRCQGAERIAAGLTENTQKMIAILLIT